MLLLKNLDFISHHVHILLNITPSTNSLEWDLRNVVIEKSRSTWTDLINNNNKHSMGKSFLLHCINVLSLISFNCLVKMVKTAADWEVVHCVSPPNIFEGTEQWVMPALATSSLLREEKQLNHVTVPDYHRFIPPQPDCPAHTSKFSAPPELVCEYQVIKTLHVPLGVVPGHWQSSRIWWVSCWWSRHLGTLSKGSPAPPSGSPPGGAPSSSQSSTRSKESMSKEKMRWVILKQ